MEDICSFLGVCTNAHTHLHTHMHTLSLSLTHTHLRFTHFQVQWYGILHTVDNSLHIINAAKQKTAKSINPARSWSSFREQNSLNIWMRDERAGSARSSCLKATWCLQYSAVSPSVLLSSLTFCQGSTDTAFWRDIGLLKLLITSKFVQFHDKKITNIQCLSLGDPKTLHWTPD